MNNLKPKFYTSVDQISQETWNILGCCDNIYYTPEFLRAFELANDDIDFNYIVIFKNNTPVAFANTQIVTIGVETITKNIKTNSFLNKMINALFRRNPIRVMFCGNVFLSGEYGTFLKAGEDKILTFRALSKAVYDLMKSTPKLHAVFVKDFENESLYITKLLEDFAFTPMHVEPNMIIHLRRDWISIDDFKSDLKSKYRVKSNKADTQSQDLEIKSFDEGDILNYQSKLQQLYENTIANANFNAQVLNLNTYKYLKSYYGDRFIVRGYFHEGELIGFLTAMINGENFDAHFIGLNYELNKQYAIYPRILNDYVRLGIKYGCKQINLGRTASEIKSTLGAVPEQLTCYIRHKRGYMNKILKPFARSVKIKTYRQHRPFKNEKEASAAS
ncbi:MAG: hypothetical protein HKO90_01245 [Flavobacteriaceae bacterium]|nr:hypothetical protein [Bacteroidia bacterium]NNK86883.1 hypothetical protein [Flavobacteriaceae bacterium]